MSEYAVKYGVTLSICAFWPFSVTAQYAPLVCCRLIRRAERAADERLRGSEPILRDDVLAAARASHRAKAARERPRTPGV